MSRRSGIRFADKDMRQYMNLRASRSEAFQRAIRYDRKALQDAKGFHVTRQMLLAAATAALTCATPAHGEENARAACDALAGRTIAANEIGLPTRGADITSAALVAGEDQAGEFCKVLGAIHAIDRSAPDIHFEVNLPSRWNGKALQSGGGGYDGTLVTGLATNKYGQPDRTPLASGYATFGSDSGHAGAVFDGSFAMNDEALANFAGAQIKKTHDAAFALIKVRYGREPSRTYFEGASQGGHEALIAIQRWPQSYDGAIAIHPVYDFIPLQLDGNAIAKALYAPGAWLDPGKAGLISSAVMAACDGLDGAKDGLISNVAACRAAFDITSLRCPGGMDAGDHCLSDAQIGAVRVMASDMPLPFKLAGGIDHFGHWPILEGGDVSGRFGFGASPDPGMPPVAPQAAFLLVASDQAVRFMILRDPRANSLTFDPAPHRERIQALSQQIDASDTDIWAFAAHGGKLILVHGTSDMAVPPSNTIAYAERLRQKLGQQTFDEAVRFYLVPGFGHGNQGQFVMAWDSLAALDAWVENGTAPGQPVAVDVNKATAGRTRPLCRYPAWPQYESGDPNKASSFDCVPP
jgi:feruloyl esterase